MGIAHCGKKGYRISDYNYLKRGEKWESRKGVEEIVDLVIYGKKDDYLKK